MSPTCPVFAMSGVIAYGRLEQYNHACSIFRFWSQARAIPIGTHAMVTRHPTHRRPTTGNPSPASSLATDGDCIAMHVPLCYLGSSYASEHVAEG